MPLSGTRASTHTALVGHSSPVTPFAQVVPGYTLRFPHDEGSHPDFRIEWWYVTGWLEGEAGPLGFQITFFRARPELKEDNPSAFVPRQILVAHAAVSDPRAGKLMHAQRAARDAFALAGADQGRTRVWVDDWVLEERDGSYSARIAARDFSLELTLEPTQPPLLQGEGGMSRKGPRPQSASYYYSLPQLRVRAILARVQGRQALTGRAWLDHEWSSQYMDERAKGWDWIGINLDDGGALMAFRMRDQQGSSLWAGGTHRRADGSVRLFASDDIRFTPRRRWRSPRTGTDYPIVFLVQAGALELMLEPLMDDQENDTRATTGTIYWEGAVRALRDGNPIGRGYLELTGYWRPLNL
ncbi:MAG: carotenoid 1,2-hydratase [Betaproteobacteria bacterium]|nr:carotenoid 1,2-hydratase [Betaproteobacteria bacterium]MDH5534393.1 carotenoid 1,2-hydratase [Betaproteobacteria bacterium]